MILLTIRKYLGIFMAMVAAISTGVALVNHFRYETASLQLDKALSTNESLTQINKDNSSTIEELISQRVIDDKLINLLNERYETLNVNSLKSLDELKRLKENDSALREILDLRHPISINGLLNDAGDGD